MIVAADATLWDQQYDLPLLERLGPAQDEIIAHVAQVNASIGVAAKPASTEVRADFHADVRAAMAGMPACVLALLDGVLAGRAFCAATGLLGHQAISSPAPKG